MDLQVILVPNQDMQKTVTHAFIMSRSPHSTWGSLEDVMATSKTTLACLLSGTGWFSRIHSVSRVTLLVNRLSDAFQEVAYYV